MKRALALFGFLTLLSCGMGGRAAAETATQPGFNQALAASVWSAALAYIAPRALENLTVEQMALWGLNGLTALDPDLSAEMQGSEICLSGPGSIIFSTVAPQAQDAKAWGQAAARVALAAYDASPTLQAAGTQAIIGNFFDELFNHFDPYSRYEPPEQAAQDQLMIVGLAGTGLTLGAKDGRVVVTGVAADSPADNAGITAGAVLLGFNGQNAYPAAVDSLNAAQNGLPNSTVMLSWLDPADANDPSAAQTSTLTRGFIPPQTVFPAPDLAPGIAVLKITSFNKGTSAQFSTALANLMAESPPPGGLVIDLRGNRGGVLRQAVLVADSLLPAGLIAEAQGRDPDAEQVFKAEGSDITGGARLAVLVDGQTASAAEILAAALADDGRAVVIGSETLGKGLVQTVTALPDGGELYVTWSRVLAPRGWPIQSLGVLPQICTSLGQSTLNAELTALAHGSSKLAQPLAQARAVRAPVGVDAVLAIRHNCPADIGGDPDMQAALAVLQNQSAYQTALLP